MTTTSFECSHVNSHEDDSTHAYALALEFSTYVLCDISVIGTETSVGLMKARKARYGQSSVTVSPCGTSWCRPTWDAVICTALQPHQTRLGLN